MIWIPHIFLGFRSNESGGNSRGTSCDDAPLHPRQQFRRLCNQIASNDGHLQDLCLYDVPTMTQKGMMKVLLKSLSENTCLQRLHLQLGEDTPASRRIMGALHRKSCTLPASLMALSLSGTTLHAKQLSCVILEGVGNLPRLNSLDLSRCHIQEKDIRCIDMQLSKVSKPKKSKMFPSLQEFNLERNSFSGGPGLALLINHVGTNSDMFSCLKVLNLSRNKLTMDFCILEMLYALNLSLKESLRELDMSYNLVHITCETPLQIMESFPCLRTLRLSGNAAASRAQVGPFEPIRTKFPSTLRFICLRGCNLYDEDVLLLTRAMREERRCESNKTTPILDDFDLSFNLLTEDSLVDLLHESPLFMRKLNLARNLVQTGNQSVQILEGNSNCKELLELNLHRNSVPRAQLRQIEFWVHLNASGARHFLAPCRDDQVQASVAVWTQVLSRSGRYPEVLYHILINFPCLLQTSNYGAVQG